MPAYGKRRDLVVVGSKMSARVDYLRPQELYLFDIRLTTEKGIPVAVENNGNRIVSLPCAEPLKEELKQFMFCVNSRQRPPTDGLVGLRAVVMAEAALASAEISKAVTLPFKGAGTHSG